jgi:hypothetical protein
MRCKEHTIAIPNEREWLTILSSINVNGEDVCNFYGSKEKWMMEIQWRCNCKVG